MNLFKTVSERIYNKIYKKKLPKVRFIYLVLLTILLVASFFRFINYNSRWSLGYDQARDIIVSQTALEYGYIPTIGPFTSAAAIVYGPWWYYFMMILESVSFGVLILPWVFLTWLTVASCLLMFLIGKNLYNEKFGLLAAGITAFSYGQIGQSADLTQLTLVGVLAFACCYIASKYIKNPSIVNSFFLSLLIALSITIHLQAINLIFLLIVVYALSSNRLKNFLPIVVGFIFPFIPLILFDLSFNNYETRNLIDYLVYGRNKIYVPNRWLTYAFIFWPQAWGRMLVGVGVFGYLMTILFGSAIIYSLIKKKISRGLLIFILGFLLFVFNLRYFKGELGDSYLLFSHPFLILFVALALYQIIKFNKTLGFVLLSLTLLLSSYNVFSNIQKASNGTYERVSQWRNMIDERYPGKSIALYDYKLGNTSISFPLAMFLHNEQKLDRKGVKVGLIIADKDSDFKHHFPSFIGQTGGYQFFDLSSSTSAQLSANGWALIDPKTVYDSIQNWYKKE